MSDYIDTREGWVRHEIEGATPIRDEEHVVMEYQGHQAVAYWLPEVSLPPLPTEPYTVIRTKGRKGFSDWVLTLNEHGHWVKAEAVISAAELPRLITGFEVLSEPLAVTAKAVLDRVRDLLPMSAANEPRVDEALTTIAREFGVSR